MVVLSLWFYVSQNNTLYKRVYIVLYDKNDKKKSIDLIFFGRRKREEKKSFNKINHCDSFVLKTKKYIK